MLQWVNHYGHHNNKPKKKEKKKRERKRVPKNNKIMSLEGKKERILGLLKKKYQLLFREIKNQLVFWKKKKEKKNQFYKDG
jgi:hypothetical protein